MQHAVQENTGNIEPLFAAGGVSIVQRLEENKEPDIEPGIDSVNESSSSTVNSDQVISDPEILAMNAMINVMVDLNDKERDRVLRWANERFIPSTFKKRAGL